MKMKSHFYRRFIPGQSDENACHGKILLHFVMLYIIISDVLAAYFYKSNPEEA